MTDREALLKVSQIQDNMLTTENALIKLTAVLLDRINQLDARVKELEKKEVTA